MNRRSALIVLAIAAAAAYVVASSVYVVGEGRQALVVRLGAPVGVAAKPGLRLKAPFIDSVFAYDTRLLLLEPPTEQVILGDQKRLEVQTYARYRIVDPLRFYQALRTIDQARVQLVQFVSSSVRRQLGEVPLQALLTDRRDEIINKIKAEVAAEARPLGVEIDEVRFHRADLPAETSQAIYDRMKSERQREAKELRAQGFEWAQQIQAKADRERTVILSEAQRAATISRGEGDAEADRVLADAFGKDAKFYRFYRALQTYRRGLADAGPTLVLSPDADFLTVLRNGPPAATAAPPSPSAAGEPAP
ncbi:MAG: protease modulator HflC [Hyphomicrobiales bacterium]|nr:protease modulator HflC [Hyphomicrobiales bacterium]MBV8664317.1 protease modulator HflC [Hyphomicrobiales bacterium]